MKLNWGWKIVILYMGFVAIIVVLVTKSMHQHMDRDLVSKDYYKDEIAYQGTLDAAKNQSTLSAPIAIHASDKSITLDFPQEFKDQNFSGNIEFYSSENAEWDKAFKLPVQNNSLVIDRSQLHKAFYKLKINWEVNAKKYYQESEINLHS